MQKNVHVHIDFLKICVYYYPQDGAIFPPVSL